jgi:hypothetical protein
LPAIDADALGAEVSENSRRSLGGEAGVAGTQLARDRQDALPDECGRHVLQPARDLDHHLVAERVAFFPAASAARSADSLRSSLGQWAKSVTVTLRRSPSPASRRLM